MFEKLTQKAPTLTPEPKIDQFCALYTKFIRGTAWLNSQIAAGHDVARDKADFKAMTAQMDDLWAGMDKTARQIATERLVEAQELPDRVLVVLRMFKGSVVALH